jgi:predicted dehydrogenase
MSKPLGIGIIGAGVIFDTHARALDALRDRARLVGLAEIDAGKRAAATDNFFIPIAVEDYHELFRRDDIDVIHVCTSPALHERMVIDSLAAGKYVICEKPLAHTLESADRIIEAARNHPGRLSTVYQLRYLPEIRRMIHLRDQGEFGKLLFGQAKRFARLAGSGGASSGWWGRWQTAGGGVVTTQFIHHLDQLCHLFGRAVEVTATIDTLQESIESEDAFSATIRFDSGALVTCCATVSAQDFSYNIDVIGSRVSAHIPWALKCADAGLKRQLEARLLSAFPPAGGQVSNSLPAKVVRKIKRKLGIKGAAARNDHWAYLAAVYDAIRANQPVPVGPEEARQSLELCTAIYTSGILGGPVSLPLDASTPFYAGITPDAYRRTAQPATA